MDWSERIGSITRQRVEDILDKVVAVKGEHYVDPNALENAHVQALRENHIRECTKCADGYCAEYPWGPSSYDCEYFDLILEAPSCIVGHVLHEMGVRPDDAEFEGPFVSLASELKLDISVAARHLLQVAQNAQDFGMTWADAVAFARRALDSDEPACVCGCSAGVHLRNRYRLAGCLDCGCCIRYRAAS